jgi:hypothetical protein
MSIARNTHTLMMLLLYVIRRAGTFTMEEKVRLIEFVAHLAQNPDADINLSQIQETSIRRLT